MYTNQSYTPWQQLPAPEPRTISPPNGYFYHNTAKHLIRDTVRLMMNGLSVDLDKVEELESTLDTQLANVESELASNPYIQQYLQTTHKNEISTYIADRKSRLRDYTYYLKPFNHTNMEHRSYFMHLFATQQNITEPTDLLPTGVPKWPANTVKKLSSQFPLLTRLLAGTLQHNLINDAMIQLATDKATIYNEKFISQISNPDVPFPKFNPASSLQKRELFDMLGIESESTSKTTGEPSFNRDEIERINKETTDPHVEHLTQCFIDHSFAAIVRNNFIEAFYKYTIDGKLYGNYKLFGAKSFRMTSNSPNMLNAPSTGSVYAKPIKRCFKTPKGKIIAAIDYSALEDRVFANLTKDSNKIATFTEGLDGHSLSATYYYPERTKSLIGDFSDHKEASKLLKNLVDEGNKDAKALRQDAKPISFGLAYGSFPAKVASTIKCSLKDAEAIFNAYHNDMYPGITNYRENYILPVTKEQGKLHLGLGCYIYSDNADKDIRTLHNSSAQYWSILTLLTINKMHQLIDNEGLQHDIQIVSTIYDSIYAELTDDDNIIKWYNDNIVPVMEQDFMLGQVVKNEARVELGYDWADMIEIPEKATIDDIKIVKQHLSNNVVI